MSDTDTSADFSAFEAAAIAGDPAPEDKPEAPKADEPLELTADQALDDDGDEDDADDGEDGDDQPQGKRRSKPVSQRIAEERRRRGDVERENEALRARLSQFEGEKPVQQLPEKPQASDFEYGEIDPAYVEALTDWKLETRDVEKRQAEEANRSQREVLDTINTGISKASESAKAKYDDFDVVIADAVEARGGEPLPPLLTIGIGVSPVGGDIMYRLATDDAVSKRLERLAKGGQATSNAMALALGELEGEYLDDDSDTDLDLADQLDMARLLGRMRTRLKGTKAPAQQEQQPARVSVTQAPEPPQQRARGGGGKFQTDASTSDFAAFEKMANARR